MRKRIFLVVTLISVAAFFTMANAQDYTIGNYVFTWHAAKAGDVRMNIQKKPAGVSVILASPGGALARLTMTPSQGKAVGEVLKNTGEYYDKQMKNKEPNAKDMASAGDYRVYFSSSRGAKFQVSVRKSAVGAAVLMNKDQALKMGKYLGDAEKMATLVNDRVKP